MIALRKRSLFEAAVESICMIPMSVTTEVSAIGGIVNLSIISNDVIEHPVKSVIKRLDDVV